MQLKLRCVFKCAASIVYCRFHNWILNECYYMMFYFDMYIVMLVCIMKLPLICFCHYCFITCNMFIFIWITDFFRYSTRVFWLRLPLNSHLLQLGARLAETETRDMTACEEWCKDPASSRELVNQNTYVVVEYCDNTELIQRWEIVRCDMRIE